MQDPKNRQKLAVWAPSHIFVGLYLRKYKSCIDNRKKNLLNSNISPPHVLTIYPLTAEIRSGVWGTPANFNGFHVLAALLHGTLVVGVGQTLRRWTEGATYIRQGGHHVGHWPTFLVNYVLYICHCIYLIGWFSAACRTMQQILLFAFQRFVSIQNFCHIYTKYKAVNSRVCSMPISIAISITISCTVEHPF